MIGETIGNYRILSTLGSGGMGVVYLAEHKLIGRRAAIKVLLPELSANQDMVGRFFNEARSTATIKHIGLIDIFDFGHHDNGCAYIAMEFLEGESLAELLRRQPRPGLDLTIAVIRQVASAVGAAHGKGIVHRDLKPDNVFLIPDDESTVGIRAKVLDFGIAKLAADGGPAAGSKTRTGSLMGTPLYMSPEQCKGAGQVDLRSDIYSLGCIFYEMLVGQTPFVREGMGEIIGAHLYETPPSPRQFDPEIPQWIDDLVMRTLIKRPSERVQTMDDLARELGGRPSARMGRAPTPVQLQAVRTPAPPVRTPAPPVRTPVGPHAATLPTPTPGFPGTLPLAPAGGTPITHSRTTLGSAAAEALEPARGRRRKVMLVAAAAVAVGAVVVALLVSRGRKKDDARAAGGPPVGSPAALVSDPPSPSPSPSLSPSLEPSPSAEPSASASASASASPSTSPSPEPSPVVEPAAAPIELRIDSEPSKAAVLLASTRAPLGKTPLTLQRPAAELPLEVIVERAGYRPEALRLTADAPQPPRIKLKKERTSERPTASRSPRPSASPKVKQPAGDGWVDPFKD